MSVSSLLIPFEQDSVQKGNENSASHCEEFLSVRHEDFAIELDDDASVSTLHSVVECFNKLKFNDSPKEEVVTKV